jgi:hypothetical protein
MVILSILTVRVAVASILGRMIIIGRSLWRRRRRRDGVIIIVVIYHVSVTTAIILVLFPHCYG